MTKKLLAGRERAEDEQYRVTNFAWRVAVYKCDFGLCIQSLHTAHSQ